MAGQEQQPALAVAQLPAGIEGGRRLVTGIEPGHHQLHPVLRIEACGLLPHHHPTAIKAGGELALQQLTHVGVQRSGPVVAGGP